MYNIIITFCIIKIVSLKCKFQEEKLMKLIGSIKNGQNHGDI